MISFKDDITNNKNYFSDFTSKTLKSKSDNTVQPIISSNTDKFEYSKTSSNAINNKIWYYLGGAAIVALLGYIFRRPIARLFHKPIKGTKTPPNNPIDIPKKPTDNPIDIPNKPIEQPIGTLEQPIYNGPKPNKPIEPNTENISTHPHVTSPSSQTSGKKPNIPDSTIEHLKDVHQRTLQQQSETIDKLMSTLKIDPSKKDLIMDIYPKLSEIELDMNAKTDILKSITKDNKDFVELALPAISKYFNTFDLEGKIPHLIEVLSKDNVMCLEKLAENTTKFNIKTRFDMLNILSCLTKDNMDFAFNELFPTLIQNSEKYGIKRAAYLGKYLKIVTPQNKAFMLNDVIPKIQQNKEQLGLNCIDEIINAASCITKDNYKSLQKMINSKTAMEFLNEDGFFDINKFTNALKEI